MSHLLVIDPRCGTLKPGKESFGKPAGSLVDVQGWGVLRCWGIRLLLEGSLPRGPCAFMVGRAGGGFHWLLSTPNKFPLQQPLKTWVSTPTATPTKWMSNHGCQLQTSFSLQDLPPPNDNKNTEQRRENHRCQLQAEGATPFLDFCVAIALRRGCEHLPGLLQEQPWPGAKTHLGLVFL